MGYLFPSFQIVAPPLNCEIIYVEDALLEDLMSRFSRATAEFEALRQIHLKLQFHEKSAAEVNFPAVIHCQPANGT